MKRSFASWPECVALREFRSLLDVGHEHPNIVQLYEVVREANAQLYFIFEYMPDGNLYEYIQRHTYNPEIGTMPAVLSESRIRSILTQVFQGLAFLHKKGYVHRDMKPENILLKGDVCKLADFGLAREVACQKTKTEYISTRWYRAPEVLLRSPHYGKPIDLFGVGCIVAELFSKQPLFPGETEVDQLDRLTDLLGSPEESWKESTQLASNIGFEIPVKKPVETFESRVPTAPPSAIDLMRKLLQWNPKDRPTCDEALQHTFLVIPKVIVVDNDFSGMKKKKRSILPLPPTQPTYIVHPAKRRRNDQYVSPRSIQHVFDAVLPPQMQPQALFAQPYSGCTSPSPFY